MHPPVPFVGRQMSKDFEVGGHVIPKDTSVGVSIYALHHNPHVWGDDHMVSIFYRIHNKKMIFKCYN